MPAPCRPCSDCTIAGNSGLQWADGTTLNFDGGAGTIAAIGSGIPNNGSLRITNAGSFTAKENFNIGNGSLVVDGTNSKFILLPDCAS